VSQLELGGCKRRASSIHPSAACVLRMQVGPDVDVAAIVDDECRSVASKPSAVSGHASGIPSHPHGGTSSQAGGWKGRAQKILLLKAKLKEARDEINLLRERVGEEAMRFGDDGTATVMTRRTAQTGMTSATRRIDVDSVAKYELQVGWPCPRMQLLANQRSWRNDVTRHSAFCVPMLLHHCSRRHQESSREKARQLEKLQESLEQANVEVEALHKKHDAAKARVKVRAASSSSPDHYFHAQIASQRRL
jgi:hypothetical protein